MTVLDDSVGQIACRDIYYLLHDSVHVDIMEQTANNSSPPCGFCLILTYDVAMVTTDIYIWRVSRNWQWDSEDFVFLFLRGGGRGVDRKYMSIILLLFTLKIYIGIMLLIFPMNSFYYLLFKFLGGGGG